jgi:hypothetical protein
MNFLRVEEKNQATFLVLPAVIDMTHQDTLWIAE